MSLNANQTLLRKNRHPARQLTFFGRLSSRNVTCDNCNVTLGAVHKLCHLGRGEGEGGSPKDDLLDRPYLIIKRLQGWEGVRNLRF